MVLAEVGLSLSRLILLKGGLKMAEKNKEKEAPPPPQRVGVGHARKFQKMNEKAKKMWRGGKC